MQEHMRTLHAVASGVDSVEERHNEVLDTHAEMKRRLRELNETLHQRLTHVHEDIVGLRSSIHERIGKAKRATVLLSLIAQQEELRPVQTRVDKQPYELYATSEWFALLLEDCAQSGERDA